MFTLSYLKLEQVPNDDFTKPFVHLLKSASESDCESCNTFYNAFCDDAAEKEKAFFPSSERMER